MELSIQEFFHDFRQELLSGAAAKGCFQLTEFMESFANELVETGFSEGFEPCHFRAPRRGMRVDGYWFDEEGSLALFIADFDSRNELESLTRTDVDAAFTRAYNFFQACTQDRLASDLEVTSPEFGLARQIDDRKGAIRQLSLILLSERVLSKSLKEIPDTEVAGVPATHHIWDITRLQRLHSSRGQKEALDLNFEETFGNGIPSLAVHAATDTYQAYLMVIPADVLASLYEKFGARLLEQNVRTFLQARGNVNKGIRSTILNEPEMFFAYNNGITATAQSVETSMTASGLVITRVVDLQIVNGGQTTASLFHTRKRDKADLSRISVQMKLSVIDSRQSEMIVPKISEYANTQNRVNAADFFSNHPFHVRMEEFSRRLWAPAQKGAQRETKWFYERARGQYADAQTKLTSSEQKKFKSEYPKLQMFTKTDLAKFENVWDDHPRLVNLGAQKNFAAYAERIGKEWEKSHDVFNELYFKRAVARAILFRATERIVSSQPWYNGGYRANIVAYTLALLGEISKRKNENMDFQGIWRSQMVDAILEKAIAIVAEEVNKIILMPQQGVSNITEWCKKDACWRQLQARSDSISSLLPNEFHRRLVARDQQVATNKAAVQTQKIDDGIEAQKKVLSIPSTKWAAIRKVLNDRGLLTPKDAGVLDVAVRMPLKIPTEKQCFILLTLLDEARNEGLDV